MTDDVGFSKIARNLADYIKNEGVSQTEILAIVRALFENIMRQEAEARKISDHAAELMWFQFFTGTGPDVESFHKDYRSSGLHEFLLRNWVKYSRSSYAIAYRFGFEKATKEITKNRVDRAAEGRRKIGKRSREKVMKEAMNYKHMSKGNAAFEIAENVKLDPGTVRRYLSELFPGEKWKL